MEEYFKAEVISLGDSVRLKALTGELKGQEFDVDFLSTAQQKYDIRLKDKFIILSVDNPEGTNYTIVDYVRTDSLAGLFALFIIVSVFVGKKWALASVLGMVYSFLIIFFFILPRITSGGDPVFNAIVGGALITPVTFYLSHGVNHKTHVAIISTVLSLVTIGILSLIFINATRLSGFASEEAIFLSNLGDFNMKGILLAGIIIGSLGILDDITVSQASVVKELKDADINISKTKLFISAMNVGRDHIASLVNTLVLVYAGAALPLLLLFTNSGRNFLDLINIEMVADEIVRTLVGSIGLILAVPLTTLIAVYWKK